LVEVLQDGWDLAQLQALTDYLLANAYSIDEINAVRRRLSKIKGGGLWRYVGERPVACLMISDVPDDDPAIIGSGLLFPVHERPLPTLPRTPKEWSEKLENYSPNKVPESFSWKIIACLEDAKKAAAEKADSLNYQVKIMPDFLQGDASAEAKNCVNVLKENRNVVCIWGGETTVKLPENAGQGGRNQHLALSAAIEIEGLNAIHLLAAGTDGSDGMTTATGAIIDGLTVQQGAQQNLNAVAYLKKADSNSFFKVTNNLITTGATGTNVMDLVIGIYHQK
jgi:hydroxypyruvate reductase